MFFFCLPSSFLLSACTILIATYMPRKKWRSKC